MEASWSSEELRNGFLPDDFHHLWSILCINPENRVKMSSVKTDLKMIRNILPEEVYHIYNEVYKLLEQKQDSKCALNDYNDLYKYMALNYLKYGLAGIEVKNNRYCVNCGQDEKTNTTSICNIGNSKGHKIKCFQRFLKNTKHSHRFLHYSQWVPDKCLNRAQHLLRLRTWAIKLVC